MRARALGALTARGHLVAPPGCIGQSLSPVTWAFPKHKPVCEGEEAAGLDFSNARDVTPAMSQRTLVFTVTFQNIFRSHIQAP